MNAAENKEVIELAGRTLAASDVQLIDLYTLEAMRVLAPEYLPNLPRGVCEGVAQRLLTSEEVVKRDRVLSGLVDAALVLGSTLLAQRNEQLEQRECCQEQLDQMRQLQQEVA